MKTLKKICLVLSLLLISTFLFAETDDVYSSFDGKTLGIQTGSSFDVLTTEIFPNSNYAYFQTAPDLVMALQENKIDAFLVDSVVAALLTENNKKITVCDSAIQSDKVGFAFAKTDKGNMLLKQFNSYLKKIKDDGTYDSLLKKWYSDDESIKTIDTNLSGTNGTVRVATNLELIPYAYIKDNKPAGYEVDLTYMFCREYGYNIEIEDMSFDSMIPYLKADRSDMAFSNFSITEERKKSVFMSDPTAITKIVLVVRNSDIQQEEHPGFFESLKNSFYRNFIVENRYRLVLSGLAVTVRISILSAIVGSILAFGICMQRKAKNPILSNTAATFIRIIQGLPVVVFLMILYYIVFKKSKVSSEIVAIIGFSINFGVYVSEMMRTSIDSVDKGQIEAAYALGFKPVKAFVKITAPQALKHMLPVYKGEFIAMVKMTSVVGYIAIQDLTKAGDIIRSRTFDAFFPLIATAIIYFAVSYAFVVILNRIEFNLEPKNRKNVLKGVTTR